jgi:prevent-host-death family protein
LAQEWQVDMKVTTAELVRNFGALADRALTDPLTITKNGRERLVLLSVEEFTRLKQRDRRAVRPEDFSDRELDLIAKAEVPAEYSYLDAELAGWKP